MSLSFRLCGAQSVFSVWNARSKWCVSISLSLSDQLTIILIRLLAHQLYSIINVIVIITIITIFSFYKILIIINIIITKSLKKFLVLRCSVPAAISAFLTDI